MFFIIFAVLIIVATISVLMLPFSSIFNNEHTEKKIFNIGINMLFVTILIAVLVFVCYCLWVIYQEYFLIGMIRTKIIL